MINDRLISLSVGNSRRSVTWKPIAMLLSEFYEKLRTPFRSPETFAEYMAMKKAAQDDLKDAQGGYVCGTFSGPRRKADSVTGRDVITLDLDSIPAGGTEDVLRRVEGLGAGYCVYSTRKHHGAAPRLRVLIPLDRTVSADEYEPCARKMAEYIGLEMADPTTFEASRLMYWPSCCSDGAYVYHWADKPFVSARGLLAQYADWRDVSLWPALPSAQAFKKLAVKQGDPEAKTGVVGAFCRTYDVYRAMEKLLPGIYEPVENIPGRYTYIDGSTTGGAVVYDGGKFLYSHHATDPCGGKLVNAFDLVRLHRFGELDEEAAPEAFGRMLPSYKEMCKFAADLPEVNSVLATERGAEAARDFEEVAKAPNPNLDAFMGGLENEILTTKIVRETLEVLGIGNKLNIINHKVSISGAPNSWSYENTENNLPVYLRDFYIACRVKHAGKNDICDRLDVVADEGRFNPVLEAMRRLPWDGTDRIKYAAQGILRTTDAFDALLIKKWFWQTISLALNDERQPYGGDGALVLQGRQGIGKTSFFREICVWPDLFIEGKLIDARDKDSVIQATENWICELGELERMTRADDKTLKAMITNSVDVYRTPYARKAVRRARRTSFCGTVNPDAFLVDETGNRRYWVVAVQNADLRALQTMSEQDKLQLWAQAYSLYLRDPQGFRLTPEERDELDRRNAGHSVILPGELELMELFDFDMPVDKWQWTRPAQILTRGNIPPERIGRAIAKIAKTYGEGRVQKRHTEKGTAWLLPLKHGA
jgi:hypothetical protein